METRAEIEKLQHKHTAKMKITIILAALVLQFVFNIESGYNSARIFYSHPMMDLFPTSVDSTNTVLPLGGTVTKRGEKSIMVERIVSSRLPAFLGNIRSSKQYAGGSPDGRRRMVQSGNAIALHRIRAYSQ